jgi:hypothetical protein
VITHKDSITDIAPDADIWKIYKDKSTYDGSKASTRIKCGILQRKRSGAVLVRRERIALNSSSYEMGVYTTILYTKQFLMDSD